jgi:hypothetical protein
MRRLFLSSFAGVAALATLAFTNGARAETSIAPVVGAVGSAFSELTVSGDAAHRYVVVVDGSTVVADGLLGTNGQSTLTVPSGVTGQYQLYVEGGDGRWTAAVVDPFHGFAWDW